MSKYHSRKITKDGETFDSIKEYRRFVELSLLEKAGTITNLRRQVEFILIPAQWETFERYSDKTGNRLKDGRKCVEQKCSYFADFVYFKDGQKIVEDTKGVKTKDYIIKRKLMRYLHDISIHEV